MSRQEAVHAARCGTRPGNSIVRDGLARTRPIVERSESRVWHPARGVVSLVAADAGRGPGGLGAPIAPPAPLAKDRTGPRATHSAAAASTVGPGTHCGDGGCQRED